MSRLLLALALGLTLGGPPLQWAAGLLQVAVASADAGSIFDPNGQPRTNAGGIFDPNGSDDTDAGNQFDPDG